MKLWKKISLLCGIVFIAVVTLCCTLLLAESKSNVLNLTYQQAIDKQTNLATSFAEMAGYYSDKGDFETTSYSLIQYCQYSILPILLFPIRGLVLRVDARRENVVFRGIYRPK